MSIIRAFAADPELLARLETEAERNPAAYRRKLTLIAVLGALALNLVQLVPIAAPLMVGAAFLHHPAFLWIAAGASLFLVWLMQPADYMAGRVLSRDEAPALFAEIERIADKLESRRDIEVRLDDSFNAGALETRGFLGLVGTRCVLYLGMPLLCALSREQLLAVIAHEFGHFSRRHGWLGHWLYRAREGWIHFAERVRMSGSAFDRLAARYAEAFVPYFSTRCFVHSRRCEFEADTDAAYAVGASTFADALTRIEVIAKLWQRDFPMELSRLQAAESHAPKDFYERFIDAARDWPQPALDEWLGEALKARSNLRDTHPSLAQRLQALSVEPRIAAVWESAGSTLVGRNWRGILAEFNIKWLKGPGADWQIEHARRKHVDQPLLDADSRQVESWDVARRLSRARAIRLIDRPRGLAELKALHDKHPDDVQITYAFGVALVKDDDVTGAPILDRVALAYAGLRLPAYQRLLGFYQRLGDEDQIERTTQLLERSVERRTAAIATLFEDPDKVHWDASSLNAQAQAALAEAARADAAVTTAWLLQTQAKLVTGDSGNTVPLNVHCMVLTTDPQVLAQAELDLVGIAERYEQGMLPMVAPDEQVVVRSFFTTEPVPQSLKPLSGLLKGNGSH